MSYRDKVRKVVPYTAGEQPKNLDIIKLNTNENPYPPSPAVEKVLRELAENKDLLRLYPDMDASKLVEALAEDLHVDEDQIFVGIGSDDVLALSFLTYFTGGGTLLFPEVTYSFYKVWASLYRIPYRMIPLTDQFRIDPSLYREMEGEEIGGIIFPNPNAPTGVEEPLSVVEEILQANPDCTVIVDEAYVDFGGESAIPLLPKYENLLVVRTFSKSRSLAGLRIGFAVGSPEMISYLKDVKFSFNSYTLGLPSIAVGTAAVRDSEWFTTTISQIVETREWFAGELRRLGFEFPPSRSNFLFARLPGFSGAELLRRLRERGVLVRHFAQPGIDDYLRITIGTSENMQKVVRILEDILQEQEQ